MARSVRFHPEAAEEAEAAAEWYRARSIEAAAGFVAELSYAIERIEELPGTWPSYVADTRRFVFRVYPFNVVYRILDDEIQIVAVAHARRKPGYWIERTD